MKINHSHQSQSSQEISGIDPQLSTIQSSSASPNSSISATFHKQSDASSGPAEVSGASSAISAASLNYYNALKSSTSSGRIGDFTGHRPIMQSNIAAAPPSNATAYKLTQLGPVSGSNVVVSRMDFSRPTSASPVPSSGPLASSAATPSNQPAPNIYNLAASRVAAQRSASAAPYTQPGVNGGNVGSTAVPNQSGYYHPPGNVTKFTNMMVSGVGSKNPLKPNHFTVPNSISAGLNASKSSINNYAVTSNTNGTAAGSAGTLSKTSIKASDLIHILPNLFNTLKRRHSQSGAATGPSAAIASSNSSNALVAAVAAAGKSFNGASAAAFVAEQLLQVASSPLSDESVSPPPHSNHQNSGYHHLAHNYHSFGGQSQQGKRVKIHSSVLHQCEVCGKIYKHRNCLSKHRWEHHESWEHTKKVCQTKHQQVQLLEAAQVLAEIMLGVQPGRRLLHLNENGEMTTVAQDGNQDEDEDDDDDEEDDEDEDIEDEGAKAARRMGMGNSAAFNHQPVISLNSGEDENISIGESEYEQQQFQALTATTAFSA